jgi:ectoine hydroxylase-related dioxygenase (phytanoyl-CoA dioxygenase family)
VNTLSEQERQLDEDGFVVLPNFIHQDLLQALRQRIEALFEFEGNGAGAEFKQETGCRRLANLVDKGDVFQKVIAEPRLLAFVRLVLGLNFKLSSLNARSVDPRSGTTQPLHADMGAIPDEKGNWVCNSVWMLDPFTEQNGAMRFVPGTHRLGRLPQDALKDPYARHPDEILLTGDAGTVVIMNAHTWHGGLANQTDRPRLALHAFYARSDKPQQQYQKLLLRPQVQSGLSPSLRKLLALDDPLNDELSANPAVRSGFLK